MLHRIRILQVGDVHLPASALVGADLDDKDAKFPGALKNIISKSPLKTVFRRIYDLLGCQEFDAVLFMGDLTDLGSLPGFQACIDYIRGALRIGSGGEYADVIVGVVPGNHDVDRSLADSPGLNTKFTPLAKCLSGTGFVDLPISLPSGIDLNRDGRLAGLYLINSCWGCGEKEYIPEEFRAAISAAITSALTGVGAADALRVYYDRQLDTPAISDATIEKLIGAISASPAHCLPIVVAHHNLLPQQQTRLAPYTELVNSGRLRASLASLGRPAIFLHGHIHEDPIEILSSPKGHPLVMISAPDVLKGFNQIEIVFTNNQVPLSCHVIPYRFDASGVIKARPTIRIPIVGRGQRGNSAMLQEFYSALLAEQHCYWSRVEEIATNAITPMTTDQTLEALELLAADDKVVIDNYDLPYQNWIIRAQI